MRIIVLLTLLALSALAGFSSAFVDRVIHPTALTDGMQGRLRGLLARQ